MKNIIAAVVIAASASTAFADAVPDYIDFGGGIAATAEISNETVSGKALVERYGATWSNIEINWFGSHPKIDFGLGVARLVNKYGKTPFVAYTSVSYFPYSQSGLDFGLTLISTTSRSQATFELNPLPTVCTKYACMMLSLPLNNAVTSAMLTFRVPVGM